MEIHDYAYIVRLYEVIGTDGRMGWKGQMMDSVGREACTVWAPGIGLLWAMLRTALPEEAGEE